MDRELITHRAGFYSQVQRSVAMEPNRPVCAPSILRYSSDEWAHEHCDPCLTIRRCARNLDFGAHKDDLSCGVLYVNYGGPLFLSFVILLDFHLYCVCNTYFENCCTTSSEYLSTPSLFPKSREISCTCEGDGGGWGEFLNALKTTLYTPFKCLHHS